MKEFILKKTAITTNDKLYRVTREMSNITNESSENDPLVNMAFVNSQLFTMLQKCI